MSRNPLLVLIALISFALGREPGAVFLLIFPDARSTALGGCGVAATDYCANGYYNPAVFSAGSEIGMEATLINWLPGLCPDMFYGYSGVRYQILRDRGLGVNLTYLNTGRTEIIDPNGQHLGSYCSYDLAPQISVGYRVLSRFSAGAGIKLIYSFLMPAWVLPELRIEGMGDALTWALDAGVQYQPLKTLPLVRQSRTSDRTSPMLTAVPLTLYPPFCAAVSVTQLNLIPGWKSEFCLISGVT
jgi:hypothetical protein